MFHKFKIILFLIFYLLSFIFYKSSVFAQNKFATGYEVNYKILPNGQTLVQQNITLSNLTSDYRASGYTINIRSQNIFDITASDRLGPLKITSAKNEDLTTISVQFNDLVAGLNKILSWKLNFTTSDFAVKNGQIWEINLPGIPDEESLTSYTVSLEVPEEFGPALYFSSLPERNYMWTKENIPKGGISGAFGKYQLYDFFLKYSLKNTKSYPVSTEIALPPDTQYQKIIYQTLEPKPKNVILDVDGNYLAQYDLDTNETIIVKTRGQVKVYINPQEEIILSKSQSQKYLTSQKYWETKNPQIQQIGKSLKNPQQIYDYVVNNLIYDYEKIDSEKINRLGAVNVLQNKNKAICMEFTDLFIALARAAGIPARELDGFAYTNNLKLRPISLKKDILHAWPEYYDKDKKSWIPVDPTWGNTTRGVDYLSKLDLNHLVFVTKGLNSEYPIPAGSYKDGVAGKDVNIVISDKEIFAPESNPYINFTIPDKIISGFNFFGVLTVENHTGQTQNLAPVNINSSNLILKKNPVINIGKLPPFAREKKIIEFSPSSPFYIGENIIVIRTGSQVISKKVLLQPIIFYQLFQIIGGGVFGSIIIFQIAKKARRLYLQKQRERNNLYRQINKPEAKS